MADNIAASAAATAGTTEAKLKKAASKAERKSDGCSTGFYCYIGPNLAGLIQHGTIYRGTRSDALNAAAQAIEKHPLIKSLIVSGDELPEARLMIKKPGNALYINYRKLTRKA